MPTFVADENDQVASASRRQVVLKSKSRSDPICNAACPTYCPTYLWNHSHSHSRPCRHLPTQSDTLYY